MSFWITIQKFSLTQFGKLTTVGRGGLHEINSLVPAEKGMRRLGMRITSKGSCQREVRRSFRDCPLQHRIISTETAAGEWMGTGDAGFPEEVFKRK